MRTPKEAFLTSGHSGAFAKLASSEAFEPACYYALLQLQSEMAPTATPGRPVDPYVAIDANSQMWGAMRVLEILISLSEPIKENPENKRKGLHYE